MTAEAHDTATELESLHELLDQQDRARGRKAARAPSGFDPAALFLLDLGWANLFDPIGNTFNYRCKGCGAAVRFTQRRKHHKAHRAAARRAAGAKPGRPVYPDMATGAGDGHNNVGEEHDAMATATPTKRSTARSAPQQNGGKAAQNRTQREAKAEATKAEAAPKPTSKTAATKPAAAKPAAKKTTGGRAEAGKILGLAADYMKGRKPASAKEIAEAVVKKHGIKGESAEFNVAFVVRAAERRGDVFKKSKDRPALYSLR